MTFKDEYLIEKFNQFSLEELKIIWSGLSWRIFEVNHNNTPYEEIQDAIFENAKKYGINNRAEMDY